MCGNRLVKETHCSGFLALESQFERPVFGKATRLAMEDYRRIMRAKQGDNALGHTRRGTQCEIVEIMSDVNSSDASGTCAYVRFVSPSSFASKCPLPSNFSAPFSPKATSDVPSESTRRMSRLPRLERSCMGMTVASGR